MKQNLYTHCFFFLICLTRVLIFFFLFSPNVFTCHIHFEVFASFSFDAGHEMIPSKDDSAVKDLRLAQINFLGASSRKQLNHWPLLKLKGLMSNIAQVCNFGLRF